MMIGSPVGAAAWLVGEALLDTGPVEPVLWAADVELAAADVAVEFAADVDEDESLSSEHDAIVSAAKTAKAAARFRVIMVYPLIVCS